MMVLGRSRFAWIVALMGVLAAAVAMGLVLNQGRAAFGQQGAGAIPAFEPVGELRLELGAVDQFVYVPEDETADTLTQSISERRCVVQLSGTPLVDLSDLGPAGLSGDSMGVFGGNAGGGRGVPCSRVTSPDQTLVWKLDSTGPLAEYTGMSAVFNVEMKGSAVAVATFYLDGVLAGVRTLGSGSNQTPDQACSGDSDSGPDSGTADNCDWVIEGVFFDEVHFTATAGEYSLEGGADYPNPDANRSRITLTDAGLLDCNDGTNDSFTLADADAGLSVSGIRLRNYDGSNCVPILFRLNANAATDSFSFVKDPDAQPFAQYVFDTDWDPISATLSPVTDIAFDTDTSGPIVNGVGTPIPRIVEICTGQPVRVGTTVDGNGITIADGAVAVDGNSPLFAGLAGIDTTLNGADDMVPGNDYFEYACVLHEQITYLGEDELGNDEMVVSQRIYVAGDLRMRIR